MSHRRALIIAGLLCCMPASRTVGQPFNWDNAIIYFVMTDRFENGDPSNDHAYGRGLDSSGGVVHSNSPARFFGGDLKGLTARVADGYFTNLGVNVLWITSPLEQVHGWVGGGGGSFPAYAYHGYWPMDFTRIDGNMGDEQDLAALIQACHSRGIRVLMDVVLNHAGYNTLQDMDEQRFGLLLDGDWRDWNPGSGGSWNDYHRRFVDYGDSVAWSSWWGGDWLRAGIAGYPPCGSTDQTTCVSSLPDFRTEADELVPVPDFLTRKWVREKGEDRSADTLARPRPDASVAQHLVGWLTGWVRKLGIDGFRLDTAKHLDAATMIRLKQASVRTLREWKNEHPDERIDEAAFWMVGEVFGHGVTRSHYFDEGLDAVMNFDFQQDLERGAPIDSLYAAYAEHIGADPTFNVVSYVSSHDTKLFDRAALKNAATALMLAPGSVEIFYGDETGRPPGTDDLDPIERTRTPMNWDSMDAELLAHWQRLGQFRARHPAIAAGVHRRLSTEPYAFSRTYGRGDFRDQVVALLAEPGRVRINVSKVFEDNTLLRDAYSGKRTFVSYGMVYVDVADGGVALLEEVR